MSLFMNLVVQVLTISRVGLHRTAQRALPEQEGGRLIADPWVNNATESGCPLDREWFVDIALIRTTKVLLLKRR